MKMIKMNSLAGLLVFMAAGLVWAVIYPDVELTSFYIMYMMTCAGAIHASFFGDVSQRILGFFGMMFVVSIALYYGMKFTVVETVTIIFTLEATILAAFKLTYEIEKLEDHLDEA